MNAVIEHLNWRYATKKYDPSKKIPAGDLDVLKEAIRLSPSAYGLQPYKVVVVSDADLKEKLKPAINNQPQAVDASHLFIFANRIGLDENDVDAYIGNIARTRDTSAEALSGFSQKMKSTIVPMKAELKNNWTAHQAYIALGQLVTTAAQLKIDATPMEGFDPEAVSSILGLDQSGYKPVVMAAAGYRSAQDPAQANKKVRKPNEELFIHF